MSVVFVFPDICTRMQSRSIYLILSTAKIDSKCPLAWLQTKKVCVTRDVYPISFVNNYSIMIAMYIHISIDSRISNRHECWMSIEGGMTSFGSDLKVKMQFRGPEFYKEKQDVKQEYSCLPRIFRSPSSDYHTFYHVYSAFWRLIFFPKHRHVLMVDVPIMTSQLQVQEGTSINEVAR